jgi:hypothetical protein
MDLGSEMRSQIDYVLCFREPSAPNRERLFNNFGGPIKSLQEFSRIMDACTQHNELLLLDRTSKSGRLEDYVFYTKASLHIPAYKIGRPIFHALTNIAFVPDTGADVLSSEEDMEAIERAAAIAAAEADNPALHLPPSDTVVATGPVMAAIPSKKATVGAKRKRGQSQQEEDQDYVEVVEKEPSAAMLKEAATNQQRTGVQTHCTPGGVPRCVSSASQMKRPRV